MQFKLYVSSEPDVVIQGLQWGLLQNLFTNIRGK